MKEEIEIKIRLKDKKAIQKKLLELGWQIKELRFQRDTRVIQPTHSTVYKNVFPRVREDSNGSKIFTVKVKNDIIKDSDKKYFERDEYELEIEEPSTMLKIFYILGFTDQRVLEKYRQFWIFNGSNIDLVIDSVPFGDYLEIEGNKDEINKIVNELELQDEPRVTNAYFVEYANYCVANGIGEKQDLIFGK